MKRLNKLEALLVDASAAFGLFILLTGGLRAKHLKGVPAFSLTQFGLFLLPLAYCLTFGHEPAGSRLVPWVKRVSAWFDSAPVRTQRQWLWVSLGAATFCHALVVYLRYFSFASGMDLAIYANACHGGLFSSMKGDVWLLADHFEPVLALLTPLCRVVSPALSLLGVQTLGWGIGAGGVFALARQCGYRPALAWLCALLYLYFNGHVTIAYYDFHLLALMLAVVPWLWWAVMAERYATLIVLAILYIGLKESAPLSLAGLGAWLVLNSQGKPARRWTGAAFMVVGVITFVLIMTVVYPMFRHGEGTMYFAKYYSHLGSNMREVFMTALTRPFYFLGQLLRVPKLYYLCVLFAPFLFFPLRYPLFLLPVLPPILVNILSNNETLFSLVFHYEAEIYPALFAMAVIAFANLELRPVWLLIMLVAFTAQSPLAVARMTVPTRYQRALTADLAAHVPRDKAIAAPQRIATHLTDRDRLYMFDYWQMENDWKRADIVVVGFFGNWLGWYPWTVLEEEKLPVMLPNLRLIYQSAVDPRFRVFEVIDHNYPVSIDTAEDAYR